MATKRVEVPCTIRCNSVFRAANESRHRYRVLKGSAGSGKSYDIAQDYIAKLSDKKYRGANLLVVRKVEETNRDSTFAELQKATSNMFGENLEHVWKIGLSPLSMECLFTGSRIIFRGVNDARQREKIKSITFKQGSLTWIWIEEATELAEQDIDILDDRLRGRLDNPNLFYQMTFTFNPVSAAHWIKGKYFDVEHPDIFTHHSTYLDNRFIDAAFHRRMEMRKERDPEGYRVYGLGEWGELGGLILTNYSVHDFDTKPERFDSVVYAQDFGFNHANAILDVGFKDGEIFVCGEIYEHEKDTADIIKIAQTRGWTDQRRTMWCDSAEPDRIETWRKAGFKARGVNKDKGCVGAQIDYLKQHKIHIHPSCINTAKEISQWKWRFDQKLNAYIDEPVEVMDDAMAALRYSVESIRRGANSRMVTVKR